MGKIIDLRGHFLREQIRNSDELGSVPEAMEHGFRMIPLDSLGLIVTQDYEIPSHYCQH